MKNTKMASLLALLFSILPLILAIANPPERAPKEFQVGNAVGWRLPAVNETELYNQWAIKRRFHIGDSLRFEYKNDSVLVVDKWEYYHCNTSNPISVFNDGNTVIVLDRPGPMYFVSGDPSHCDNGQRLIVEVMTWHPIPDSPPYIASPPQPHWATSPEPSSTVSSSGESVSVTLSLVLVVLVATVVSL